ncbi:hypothetical protein TNCV_500921 [Trichonephila clavipes]|nr:hypothetical protein TNCV_500921 [Trichonephila clavipes]
MNRITYSWNVLAIHVPTNAEFYASQYRLTTPSLGLIESSALEQEVAIHPDIAAEWTGLVSIQAKPVEVDILPKSHVWWLREKRQQPRISPSALG